MTAILLYAVGGIYATWVAYLAIMALIRARDEKRLTKVALWLAYPVVVIGLLLDFTLNVTVGTALFLEPPREWLLSPRLSRLIETDPGWRGDLAAWVCVHLLDTFDPDGRHCSERSA